jgi:hypothetical protein
VATLGHRRERPTRGARVKGHRAGAQTALGDALADPVTPVARPCHVRWTHPLIHNGGAREGSRISGILRVGHLYYDPS